MPLCETCKKPFHACSGCGHERNWMYVYCKEECWKNSKEYVANKADFGVWWLSLDATQRGLFKVMFREFFGCSDYDNEIIDWSGGAR